MTRRATVAGFTLFEVLIAAGLLAMMGIILYAAMTVTMNGIRDAARMQERYHTARVALGRMQRELASAYLSKHQGENRTTKTVFLGKNNRLVFTYMGHRRISKDAKESDQGVVEYVLERGASSEGGRLVRREKVVIDDRPERDGRREVLADGVRKVVFAYYDIDKEAWVNDWKVEIDNALEEEKKKSATATSIAAATGNAALGNAAVAAATQGAAAQNNHGPDDQWLPARVKILLVLAGEEQDIEFETQARIRLQEPLQFNAKLVPAGIAGAMNPYSPFGASPGLLPGAAAGMPGTTGGVKAR